MKIDFKHLKNIDESYFEHLKFALNLSFGFLLRSILFLIHGIVPVLQIPNKFNLLSTNKWIGFAKNKRDKD